MQALLAIHTVRLCGNLAAHSTGKMRMESAAASLLYLKTRPDMFPTQYRVWFNCVSADGFKPTRRPQSAHVDWATESSIDQIHPIQNAYDSNNAQHANISTRSIAAAAPTAAVYMPGCSRTSCNSAAVDMQVPSSESRLQACHIYVTEHADASTTPAQLPHPHNASCRAARLAHMHRTTPQLTAASLCKAASLHQRCDCCISTAYRRASLQHSAAS
jgi:hypothetical protein